MTQLTATRRCRCVWLWMFIAGLGRRPDLLRLHHRHPERRAVPPARRGDVEPDLLPPDRRLDRPGVRRHDLRDDVPGGARPADGGRRRPADRRRTASRGGPGGRCRPQRQLTGVGDLGATILRRGSRRRWRRSAIPTRSSTASTRPSASRPPRRSGSASSARSPRPSRRSRSRRSRSARTNEAPVPTRTAADTAGASDERRPGQRPAPRPATDPRLRPRLDDPGPAGVVVYPEGTTLRDHGPCDSLRSRHASSAPGVATRRRSRTCWPSTTCRRHDAARLGRRARRAPGPHGRRDRGDRGPLSAHERAAVRRRARRLHRRLPAPRGPFRPALRRSGPDADDRRPRPRRRVPPDLDPGRPAPTSRTSPARRPRRGA